MRQIFSGSLIILAFTLACTPIVEIEPTLNTYPTLSPTPNWPPVIGSDPSSQIAAFYHTWYLNPKYDNRWDHWNQSDFQPPLDIGSDFYPLLGAYSSNNPDVVAQHFAWMRQAGIGVVIADWWGRGSPTDQALPLVLDMADRYGLKVGFVLEQYDGRSADSLVSDIRYLKELYGGHPALFWTTKTSIASPDNRKKALFFMWNTTQPKNGEPTAAFDYWQDTMDKVHNDETGAIVLTDEYYSSYRKESHFDGSYNYGVLDIDPIGYTYALNMPLDAWYVPGINPGFSAWRIGYDPVLDTPRRDGQTFIDRWKRMFAVGVEPEMIVITTFNEWHEGTQIEPAQPIALTSDGEAYLDYGDLGPEGYLKLTREWVDHFLTYDWPE